MSFKGVGEIGIAEITIRKVKWSMSLCDASTLTYTVVFLYKLVFFLSDLNHT